MTIADNHQFTLKLLQRSLQLTAKDGSLGLETIVSLHQYHNAYSLVKDCIAPQSTVLDWGGGSGHFSYFLSDSGYNAHIYAFDKPQFVKSEIQAGTVRFTQANSQEPVRLPFADESFDAVCSIGVLEHVREIGGNERASLEEIKRILKPDGVFICYHFPNKGSWIEFLARRFGSYSHQYTYSRQDIMFIFDKILRIEKMNNYALLPRNSLRRLPRFITNSHVFASFFNWIDKCLAWCCPVINQNWLVVARKTKL
jgi:ubiquinone/menaquinone biosynthesis C-methylase UbiE